MVLSGALSLFGQTSASVDALYTYDLNGELVDSGIRTLVVRAPATSTIVQTDISLNGRRVPREMVEEKVVRDDPSGRIVERTVRPFDPNGIPGPPEKTRIEETRNPDGSSQIVKTTYRGDINGAMRLSARAVTETRKTADGETASTVVERPTLNDSMQVQERVQVVKKKTNAGQEAEISTYRRDTNGNLFEFLRQVTETQSSNGESVSNLTQYERKNSHLELAGQTVTRTRKTPGGAEVSDVDIYRIEVPGRPAVPGKPKLLERQIIERKPVAGDKVVETLSVSRTSPNAPESLGTPRMVSERVCTGACQ